MTLIVIEIWFQNIFNQADDLWEPPPAVWLTMGRVKGLEVALIIVCSVLA